MSALEAKLDRLIQLLKPVEVPPVRVRLVRLTIARAAPAGYRHDRAYVSGLSRGRLTRACTHLWTPHQVQAVFEEGWHVVGCCHLSGL